MLRKLTDHALSTNMFLLCGDFNAEPESVVYNVTKGTSDGEKLKEQLTAINTENDQKIDVCIVIMFRCGQESNIYI